MTAPAAPPAAPGDVALTRATAVAHAELVRTRLVGIRAWEVRSAAGPMAKAARTRNRR